MDYEFKTEIEIPVIVEVSGYHPDIPASGDYPPEPEEWDDVELFVEVKIYGKNVRVKLPHEIQKLIEEDLDHEIRQHGKRYIKDQQLERDIARADGYNYLYT